MYDQEQIKKHINYYVEKFSNYKEGNRDTKLLHQKK